MFSNCNTISEIIVKARELKKEGEDPSVVNSQANARRRFLVARVEETEGLLEEHRVYLSSADTQFKAPLPFRKEYGNKPIFEITAEGVIVI